MLFSIGIALCPISIGILHVRGLSFANSFQSFNEIDSWKEGSFPSMVTETYINNSTEMISYFGFH
jgi:hypothetical protein